MIDRIEFHVGKAVEYVKAGTEDTRKALKLQREARKVSKSPKLNSKLIAISFWFGRNQSSGDCSLQCKTVLTWRRTFWKDRIVCNSALYQLSCSAQSRPQTDDNLTQPSN